MSAGRRTAYLATPHAPLLTFNNLYRNGHSGTVRPLNGAVFAWVLSNYWDTNYKASQGGDMVFSFLLDLRAGAFDPTGRPGP